jgi:predicted nucleic acid-binding protein
MIVLDTNVLSELMKHAPEKAVNRWVADRPSASLYTTTITLAEVLLGIELLPEGRRRSELLFAAETMFEVLLAGRILPFDGDAARALPRIAAQRRLVGRPISHYDVQIAAIAVSRGAQLATRNVADFAHCGVTVINPWAPE